MRAAGCTGRQIGIDATRVGQLAEITLGYDLWRAARKEKTLSRHEGDNFARFYIQSDLIKLNSDKEELFVIERTPTSCQPSDSPRAMAAKATPMKGVR